MTTRSVIKPRTEPVEASAPAQQALPLRLPEQRRTRDPVPEALVRQLLRIRPPQTPVEAR